MKQKILILISLLLGLGASAQVQWHTMAEASTAKIGDRLYFVDFYTDWCGYCKKMDRETFRDPTVAAILNKYYYPVKFNAEGAGTVKWQGQTYRAAAGSGRGAVHQFATAVLGRQMGFPTFVLFRANQAPLQAIPGYYNAHDFTILLWYFASGDSDKYPYERYQQIFDRDIRPSMEKALK